MAKPKRSTPLFEVMGQRTRRQVNVPTWVKPAEKEATPPPVAEAPVTKPLKRPPGLDAKPQAISQPTDSDKIVSIADGRLRLALNFVSCLVAALGLLVLLAAAFAWGRATVPSPESTIGVSEDEKDNTGKPDDIHQIQAEAKAMIDRAGPTGRFMVIQGHVDSVEDAKKIQKYLKSNGFYPYVAPLRNGGFQIYDAMNQNHRSPQDIAQYAALLATYGRSPEWPLSAKYNFRHTSPKPWLVGLTPR